MWTQVVGKVRLALEPMVNHWWQVPLYVSSRGLTTSLMHAGATGLEMEFDFIDDVLAIRTVAGDERQVALESKAVATFYAQTMAALSAVGVEVSIMTRPVEVVEAIPFAEDDKQRAYDGAAARRFWLALVQATRVLRRFRGEFQGKVSPVHFFWGGFDLALTRFSGRPAPLHPGGVPNCADSVMHEAYSHEVSSCGFWFGSGSLTGPAFYSYAAPEPPGFKEARIQPAQAFYSSEFSNFLLLYDDLRAAANPRATPLEFLQSTYEASAILGGWDRKNLERA
jgi:hypothetical protein